MKARRPLVGSVFTAQHCAARLDSAREHQNWQVRHWRPPPFSSQTRAGWQWARDRPEKSLETLWWTLCCLQHHSAWPVRWWVSDGLGRHFHWRPHRPPCASQRYRNEILRAIVRPYAGAAGPGFLLVQAYARPHVTRVWIQLRTSGMLCIVHPMRTSSTRLSRISLMSGKRSEIPQTTIRFLIRSMPTICWCCWECTQVRGGHTPYWVHYELQWLLFRWDSESSPHSVADFSFPLLHHFAKIFLQCTVKKLWTILFIEIWCVI